MKLRAVRSLFVLVALVGACGEPDVDGPDGGAFDASSFCEPPLRLCSGQCVSTDNDPVHCGECGKACPAGSFCNLGACAAVCSAGLTACGAACADLAVDRTHCGDCTRVCAADRDCQNGSCVCPAGTSDCNGSCVDTNADPKNCGICSRVCGADEACSMGSCVCRDGNRESDCLDGLDNDCDDLIDCADPDCEGEIRSCMGACGQGTETCEVGGTWGACEGGNGTEEICGDGIDQDCDGEDLRAPDSWEPNDDCTTCRLVSTTTDPNITVMGTFDSISDRVDCFRFNTDDGLSYQEHIRVDLTNIPPGADYDVYLYSSQGECEARNPLASGLNTGNMDEHIDWGERWGSDDSGTYFIRVVRYLGYSCTEAYSLRIRGLD